MSGRTNLRPARPSQLKGGVRVFYKGSWGNRLPVEGVIVGDHPTFEGPADNEQPTWVVRLDDGAGRWGYLHQFFIDVPAEDGQFGETA